MPSATPSPGPWSEFTLDPRRPDAAPLRASDRDREVVLNVLAQGYAEGRLDRGEYDERTAAVTRSKTLGELPPLMTDLVPARPASRRFDLSLAGPEELHAEAVAKYRSKLRGSASGWLTPSLICTVIWAMSGASFFWPIFVIVAAAIPVIEQVTQRKARIEKIERDLEKKQHQALEQPPEDT